MPFDFHPLETGYVARLHGVLEKDIVLQMALTGYAHYAGAARWIINDLRAVDMDSARAIANDARNTEKMDRSAREVGKDRRDAKLYLCYVCSPEAYDEIVPPQLAALDDVAGSRLGLSSEVPRFDTVADAFAWEQVTHEGCLPEWVAILDAPYRDEAGVVTFGNSAAR